MKILGIYRERIFSPGKVREDGEILDAALRVLSGSGCETLVLPAEALTGSPRAVDLVLSMAQSLRALRLLEKTERSGIRVVNAVSAVRNCYRNALVDVLASVSVPVPAGQMVSVDVLEAPGFCMPPGGFWLKRGDYHALCAGDVIRIDSDRALTGAVAHFRKKKVTKVLAQAHVEGPCAKFYGVGVGQNGYFKAFLSASGEDISAQAGQLAENARTAAAGAGLAVYGGDAIYAADGNWVIIDLNDWPSFSSCREAAARAISDHLLGNPSPMLQRNPNRFAKERSNGLE